MYEKKKNETQDRNKFNFCNGRIEWFRQELKSLYENNEIMKNEKGGFIKYRKWKKSRTGGSDKMERGKGGE